MNNKITSHSFFFFIDNIKELENYYTKVDKFFNKNDLICNNKFFSFFLNEKIDFDFLEKNNKLITFFIFYNKIFFKDHLKNLKKCLINENFLKISNEKLNLKMFLNSYFFNKYILLSIFILKKRSLAIRKK